MIVECTGCRAQLEVDASRFSGEGSRARCPDCATIFLLVPTPDGSLRAESLRPTGTQPLQEPEPEPDSKAAFGGSTAMIHRDALTLLLASSDATAAPAAKSGTENFADGGSFGDEKTTLHIRIPPSASSAVADSDANVSADVDTAVAKPNTRPDFSAETDNGLFADFPASSPVSDSPLPKSAAADSPAAKNSTRAPLTSNFLQELRQSGSQARLVLSIAAVALLAGGLLTAGFLVHTARSAGDAKIRVVGAEAAVQATLSNVRAHWQSSMFHPDCLVVTGTVVAHDTVAVDVVVDFRRGRETIESRHLPVGLEVTQVDMLQLTSYQAWQNFFEDAQKHHMQTLLKPGSSAEFTLAWSSPPSPMHDYEQFVYLEAKNDVVKPPTPTPAPAAAPVAVEAAAPAVTAPALPAAAEDTAAVPADDLTPAADSAGTRAATRAHSRHRRAHH